MVKGKYGWLKIKVVEMGLKIKDVVEKTSYSYDYFIQVINGFKKAPQGFDDNVNTALKKLGSK